MLSCAVSYLLAVLCRHTLWLTFVSLSGTYSAAVGAIANSTCSTCPTYSNSPAGSAALTACFCNPGSTGNHVLWCGNSCTITLTCNLCDAGTYKVETGGAVCTNCLAGEYSPTVGATSNVCQTCPTNSNAPEASDEHTDCICDAGSTGADGSACSLCDAGKYKVATGDVSCTNCSEGQYSTVIGATFDECQTCPANSNAPAASDEQTDCICDDGSTGVDGSACVVAGCEAGEYLPILYPRISAGCVNGHNIVKYPGTL